MNNVMITYEDYKLAESNGVQKQTVDRRVRHYGWSIERATTEAVFAKNVKGWIAKAEKNGIGLYAFKQRIYELGWDYERASTEPIQNRGRKKRSDV